MHNKVRGNRLIFQYRKLHQKTTLTIRVIQNKNRTLEINKTPLDKAMNKIQENWNKRQMILNCPEWGFGQEKWKPVLI